MAYAAFDGVREREKAGWTNDLHYPIDVKITRRNKLAVGEKGLRGKDLRGNDRHSPGRLGGNCAATAGAISSDQ
jgi:hypothetical protein